MNIDVVTLFPEFFAGPLGTGLVGKALTAGRASVRTIDPRQFTHDRHRTVDDTPYGGGGGMVMKPEPVMAAVAAARARGPGPAVLLSPQGRPLAQRDFERWASGDHLILVAGRYEGYDERIRTRCDEEISIGDFVLTGGEYGALVIIDGVVRLLPGTLGNKDCPEQDSFADGLLEYPHYTRPVAFDGEPVPDVLQSGHHQRLTEWRHAQALLRTRARRPDLLKRRGLTPGDVAILAPGRSPPRLVALPAAFIGPGVLAVAAAYGVPAVFAVASVDQERRELEARLSALPAATYPIREGSRPRKHRRAPPAMATVDFSARVRVLEDWAALPTHWEGRPVVRWGAERRPPLDAAFVDPKAVLADEGPATPVPCVAIGSPIDGVDGYLPVIRAATPENRLPVESVLGIYLDRILGEG